MITIHTFYINKAPGERGFSILLGVPEPNYSVSVQPSCFGPYQPVFYHC